MSRHRSGSTRAWLVPLAVVALFASSTGPVAAHHNTCTVQGSSDPNTRIPGACPELTPDWRLGITYPFRDTSANINLELSQAAHESNVLRWEWYLPSAWRFNTSIRPARAADGTVPDDCSDLFAPDGSMPNAEGVADGVGMAAQVLGGAPRYWGAMRVDPNENNRRPHNAHLGYLRTSGNVTTLCLQLRTYSTGGQQGLTGGGGDTIPADQIILPVTLERGDFGEGSGWRVTVPVEDIAPQLPSHYDFSLTTLDLEFDGVTSGTWHLENGIPARTTFSRTPRLPQQIVIATRAYGCTNGRRPWSACDETHRLEVPTAGPREFPVVIGLPPVYGPVPFAHLTRVGDSPVAGVGTVGARPLRGYGLHVGNSLLPVHWEPVNLATLPTGVTVSGYVVTAHKFVRGNLPTTPEERAAGRIIYRREFGPAPLGNSISLDLAEMPENAALGLADGKYNVTLVTVYDTPFGNGYRSDGLCDGPSLDPPVEDDGRGVLCPADRPTWVSAGPGSERGASFIQTIVRQDPWPTRYVSMAAGQPMFLVLLDIPARRAEVTWWGNVILTPTGPNSPVLGGAYLYGIAQGGAETGPSTVFSRTSDLMVAPTGPIPGFVTVGDFDLESESWTWNLTLELEAPAGTARGTFTMYNARGADLAWFKPRVPSGDPTTFPAQILAGITGQRPSGHPLTATANIVANRV